MYQIAKYIHSFLLKGFTASQFGDTIFLNSIFFPFAVDIDGLHFECLCGASLCALSIELTCENTTLSFQR